MTTAAAVIPSRMTGPRRPAGAHAALNAAVYFPEDALRAGSLENLLAMPSLAECLDGWLDQIVDENCADYTVQVKALNLRANGKLSKGNGPLPVTYRVFGHLLRYWCPTPRNVARVVYALPVDGTDGATHAPRACAYNAFLRMGQQEANVVLRTRWLPKSPAATERHPVIVGAVSDSHALNAGDDKALITALQLGLAEAQPTARATAFRGIEESEIRVVLPAVKVDAFDGGADETWCGYITARNSEVGAAAWSVSAGLYRTTDGASVACEATSTRGVHAGQRVPERMAEAVVSANDLLAKLQAEIVKLVTRPCPWEATEVVARLQKALVSSGVGENAIAAIAVGLANVSPASLAALVNLIAGVGAHCTTRGEALPLEILAGRLLVHGWDKLKPVSAGLEQAE